MTKIREEIKIQAPKEKVWAILADLGAIHNFNADVRKSYYTSEAKEGVGVSRACELRPMGIVEEKVTEWVVYPRVDTPPV